MARRILRKEKSMNVNFMQMVSIIVPVYNSEKYLTECLKSLLNQTYKNLDIIVINDGSKDRSEEIMESFARRDTRIRVFKNKNHGVSYSRNLGIEKSLGRYISFVDSDDIVSSDFIEVLVDALEKSDAEISAVGVCKKKKYYGDIFSNGNLTIHKGNDVINQLFIGYEGFLCNKLYKKEIFEKYSLKLNEKISICEDLLFNIEYLLNCNCAAFYRGEKYFYRQIGTSASHQLSNYKWFDILKSYNAILRLLKDKTSVYYTALGQYAMVLCVAEYRLRYLSDEKLKQNTLKIINQEGTIVKNQWNKINKKQRLKIMLFKSMPTLVFRYQRRLL